MPVSQIIAMGGGGFTFSGHASPIDRYILKCAGKPTPTVGFLPTAAADGVRYLDLFYSAFRPFDCRPIHLCITRAPDAAEGFLEECDVVLVGAGNTKLLLDTWQSMSFDRKLAAAWSKGVVLAGMSAGAGCWFEQILSDYAGPPKPLAGLGLLAGSFAPHYHSDPARRPAMLELVTSGRLKSGLGVDDCAAVHFVGEELRTVVIEDPAAAAYRVMRLGDRITEERLSSTLLDF